jgi:hypothetical protein
MFLILALEETNLVQLNCLSQTLDLNSLIEIDYLIKYSKDVES